jgi:two-component system, NtrC family, sensor histidine kinase HydH
MIRNYAIDQGEPSKPFRLVKYFTMTSLIVIFAGAIILSALNIHWARQMQIQKSEDYALLLIENLNHQIFLQFIIPTVLKHGNIHLRESAQFELMDKVVRSTLHSFNIDMVNIYDLNNTISYSLDREVIGKRNAGGTYYQDALEGQRRTHLEQSGNFLQLMFGVPNESRIITYAPLRAEKPLSRIPGPVLGVVELVQDISSEYQAIYRVQIRVILTSTAVMLILFLFLLLVVRRGEDIIEKRALERLKLEEQLARSKHLSNLGEMTASISHEIRNPLGIIKSSAELLKKKVHQLDPSNPMPGIIVEEASRLNGIITDFLNFARPNQPDLRPGRIQPVIDKTLQHLASELRERRIAIHKLFNDNVGPVMIDSDLLYQALLNVLINAMQAIETDGHVDIALIQHDSYVQLSLHDSGPGIDGRILEKIWDPFFTNKEKGTGLGLGIVKKIIEAHDGQITIANAASGGTEVKIVLPFYQETR